MQTEGATESDRYTMTISRMTVDKLGVKLYDKVSAVMAELVANAYDADATEVEVIAPMGEYLATKREGVVIDRDYQIEVRDNGAGMTPDEINEFYLFVGGERRNDPKRGDVSKRFGRKVMGRKGVGKLAPFGICEQIEVLSSGGELTSGVDVNGKTTNGYLTAHLILDRKAILSDEAIPYHPKPGHLDGTLRNERGTVLTLSQFSQRQVPKIDDFARQMAQRFGIASRDWRIRLSDLIRTPGDPDCERVVGEFNVERMPGTAIIFASDPLGGHPTVMSPSIELDHELEAGFWYEETFFPVTGWVSYSKESYRDDLMAGVRIYCRGKIAAQTNIFNRGAGFMGEYSVRSYLIGELHANWLDANEDLIQTDRRDILWSSELGEAFEAWGQRLVLAMGRIARNPLKLKTWERFRDVVKIGERVQEAFPLPDQAPIRERALELAKLFGQTTREDELADSDHTERLVQLTLMLAPHVTLDDKLREAADSADSPLAVVAGILMAARVAELYSFGQIADERVRVIARVETLKDEPETLEAAFQDLISQAPWLIDPQWSPITSNQSFTTLRKEFEKYYEQETGEEIQLDNFTDSNKRADFVFSSQDNVLQIIEIKRPMHDLENEEMIRLERYVTQMEAFLSKDTHREFTKAFNSFHVTLVCDGQKLSGVAKRAYQGLVAEGRLTHIDWKTFLLRTRKMHEDFLAEAERQKRDVARAN